VVQKKKKKRWTYQHGDFFMYLLNQNAEQSQRKRGRWREEAGHGRERRMGNPVY
jgi:hypothetical protein